MNVQEPHSVRHSYVQLLEAPPEAVFPLLCPVREADWIPGWKPRLVLSRSGVAEEGCIFVTPAEPADAVWIVTRHDPAGKELEMVKITPSSTVTKLEISLAADGADRTHATVAYEYTSLGPDGDELLAGFTPEWYVGVMEDWERSLNHYLRTGERIA